MLTPDERARYARHLTIPEFGEEGQARLKAASALCIGAGGLGSPALLYLAAAGVGRIGIADADVVDASNLQRQVLFGTPDIGRRKAEAARARLREINPLIEIEIHAARFTSANAMDLARGYDLIVDGSDNFPTRYLSSDVAAFLKIPNVYGSIFRFEGQVSVFAPHLGGPCYRCLFPDPPEPGLVPSCAEAGVLGVLPGIVGAAQASEAIKLLAGIGEPLVGRLLHFDALAMRFHEFKLRRDPACPVCGENPTITAPIDYAAFCGTDGASCGAGIDGIGTISVVDLQKRLSQNEGGFCLIDVREPAEWEATRIEGATLIPLGEIAARHGEIDRSLEVIVHCKAGGRSAKAAALLAEAGFPKVTNVAGGMDAWIAEFGI